MELKEFVLGNLNESFSLGGDGVLRYQGRLRFPNVNDLRNKILEEANGSRYSIHLGSTKMYHDLREVFLLEGLKGVIAKFVAKRSICQQVKDEHQNISGLLQEIQVPTSMWEDKNIDFVVGLPSTKKKHDSIWVVRVNKICLFYSHQVQIHDARLCKYLHR